MPDQRDIFIVATTLDEPGGVQQWAWNIGGLFADRGHRVHLIGVRRTAPRPMRSDPRFTVMNLYKGREWRADPRRPWRTWWRAVLMWVGGQRLTAAFRSASPNGVVVVAEVGAMEWVAKADTCGLAVIGMNHGSVDAARRSARFDRVKKYFPGVDRFLALTEEDADEWAHSGMTNAGAMPNPVVIRPRTEPDLTRPRIVTLARLAHENGIDMLIEAWATVSRRHPEWTLDVYGTGPLRKALREQAVAHGVAGSLRLRGRTSDPAGVLADASIFVLPSRQESQPIGLMEAMACGLPAVAFNCAPGVRELLTGELTDCLVPPGNVEAFGATLERLMTDVERRERYSVLARLSVFRYAPSVIVDRWEQLFHDLDRCRAVAAAPAGALETELSTVA